MLNMPKLLHSVIEDIIDVFGSDVHNSSGGDSRYGDETFVYFITDVMAIHH